MRRGYVPILVACLFLSHVVTECRSHHVAEEIIPAAASCTGPTPSHASGTAPCGHQHGQGHNSCRGSHCVFVRGKSRTESEQTCSEVKFARVAMTDHSSSFSARDRQAHSEITPSRPIRLHLQLQVLLV